MALPPIRRSLSDSNLYQMRPPSPPQIIQNSPLAGRVSPIAEVQAAEAQALLPETDPASNTSNCSTKVYNAVKNHAGCCLCSLGCLATVGPIVVSGIQSGGVCGIPAAFYAMYTNPNPFAIIGNVSFTLGFLYEAGTCVSNNCPAPNCDEPAQETPPSQNVLTPPIQSPMVLPPPLVKSETEH